MLIPNLLLEEITIKEKTVKNKNNLREKLLSDQQENINIKDYNFTQLIELLPTNASFSSQQVISQLLDQQLTDQQLQNILKAIVRCDTQKDVDFSQLYKQLFQQQICIQTISESLVYCKEDLALIINQLIEVYQTLIIEDPQKLQNISSWIQTLLSNNKLTIPKKETKKLLDLIKKNQQYQEAVRNIKVLVNQTPQESKPSCRITNIFF